MEAATQHPLQILLREVVGREVPDTEVAHPCRADRRTVEPEHARCPVEVADHLLGADAERGDDLDRLLRQRPRKLKLDAEAVELGDVVVAANPEAASSPVTAGLVDRLDQSLAEGFILRLRRVQHEAVEVLDLVWPLEDHEIANAAARQDRILARDLPDEGENLVERLVVPERVLPELRGSV